MTELTTCTAGELAARYGAGEVRPSEVVAAVLDRIDQVDPVLRAFCFLDRERSMADAVASDERWQRGAAIGPLDGVPVSVKDLVLTAGWPTLRGSRTVDPDQPWDVDAPSVARLREAGAVLVGKTTTPEFGCKGETNSALTGLTRNPWDVSKSPGGSSGGTAAAVAAGCGPIGLGTDGAGSVRIPAAFCGNVGFKASFGRVPLYPPSPFGTVSHVGPHAMSVRDVAVAMDVLKRPDARDWTSLPPDGTSFVDALDVDVAGWRVAWSPTLGYASVHPQVAAAAEVAVSVLEALGAHVDDVDPGFEDPLEITTGLWFTGAWVLWSSLTPEQQAVTDPDFAAQAELGSRLSNLEVQRLALRRAELGSMMRRFMESWDLLVTPAVAVPAFDARPAGDVPMDPVSMLGWTPFSYPFNLTQQPAITVPCGLTTPTTTTMASALPIGLQLVGKMFADATVLRAAHTYEEVVGPFPRPSISPGP